MGLQNSGNIRTRQTRTSQGENLRGHQNKEQDAAAIESEDDSARCEFPANFKQPSFDHCLAMSITTHAVPLLIATNLKMFPQNGLKVEPAFSAITM